MKRLPFVLTISPEGKESTLQPVWKMAEDMGASNFSVWRIREFLFCYGEYPDDASISAERIAQILPMGVNLFATPGSLPLMYHDIGIVRQDKSLIRHRVFATRLKDGCAEEYKRRHDALVEARGNTVKEGPESNFTIWNANGYIFGYCELVKSFDHEKTEDEKAAEIAWETRQLEIMDWLTDDVDWITGQKHDAIRLVYRQ